MVFFSVFSSLISFLLLLFHSSSQLSPHLGVPPGAARPLRPLDTPLGLPPDAIVGSIVQFFKRWGSLREIMKGYQSTYHRIGVGSLIAYCPAKPHQGRKVTPSRSGWRHVQHLQSYVDR